MRIAIHPHYAAIASTAALVVSLGGTGYAIAQVTGDDIKNGTVTTEDIKDHSLKSRDLSSGAVSKVRGPAWEVFREDVQLGGSSDPVVSQALPDGDYTISVSSQAVRNGDPQFAVLETCDLATPTGHQQLQLQISAGDTDQFVSMQTSLHGAGTVSFSCGGSAAVRLSRTTMIIRSVGHLHQIRE